MRAISGEMLALITGEVPAIEVGPGCRRRDLPSATGVRAWIVEMDPGSEWPHVDQHPTGEDVYVLEGEMIEGVQCYPAGSYLHFLPGSSHQPRTETGLRLFGFNVIGTAVAEAQRRVRFDFGIGNCGDLRGRGFRPDIPGNNAGAPCPQERLQPRAFDPASCPCGSDGSREAFPVSHLSRLPSLPQEQGTSIARD